MKFEYNARKFLIKLIQQRKYLIATGKSKNPLTLSEVDKLHEKLNTSFAPVSIAKVYYFHIDKIMLLPPSFHVKTFKDIEFYYNEAAAILKKYCII